MIPGNALTALYDACKASFTSDPPSIGNVDPTPPTIINVEFRFGWLGPNLQVTTNTIVFVPGDQSGSAGTFHADRKQPFGGDRAFADLDETFTIWISGADASDPTNERAQYLYTRKLFDELYRAMYLTAHGTFTVNSVSWDISKKVAKHGACLRVTCGLQHPIVDRGNVTAPVGVGADITVTHRGKGAPTVLDYAETFSVDPPP